MFKLLASHTARLLVILLAVITLPNCIHSFRPSPERVINRAHDVMQDIQDHFGAAFEILDVVHGERQGAELQSHVIMTMQEIGQHSKGFYARLFDLDHDYELFPFVYYQKMIDGSMDRLLKAQRDLVSCKYRETNSRRMRVRIDEIEDEIGTCMHQLKALRKFVVSHELYWKEKEKLEKREQDRRELLLKQERNAIEREKLYLEREKLKSKKKDQAYNVYDVTVVQYYD